MFFMPESPYYLITKGKKEEASKSLLWLRGGGAYNVEPEIQGIEDAVEEEKSIGSISLKELLTVDIYVKPFAIMMTLTPSSKSTLGAGRFWKSVRFRQHAAHGVGTVPRALNHARCGTRRDILEVAVCG